MLSAKRSLENYEGQETSLPSSIRRRTDNAGEHNEVSNFFAGSKSRMRKEREAPEGTLASNQNKISWLSKNLS